MIYTIYDEGNHAACYPVSEWLDLLSSSIEISEKEPEFSLHFVTDDEIRLILLHEITHAGRNDVFLKIFMEVMNGLNWFNPLFYMVKKSVSKYYATLIGIAKHPDP